MYIIKSCLYLALIKNIQKIADSFKRAGLDLLDVEEEQSTVLYAMNANDLLAIFEYSIRSEDMDLETMTQDDKKTIRASAINRHGTRFGAMVRRKIHEKEWKKNETNSIIGSTSSNEQSEWKAVEHQTSIWRRINLETKLSLDDAEFGQLRTKHIQRGYPEDHKVGMDRV